MNIIIDLRVIAVHPITIERREGGYAIVFLKVHLGDITIIIQ
jgi:hypothetical protein